MDTRTNLLQKPLVDLRTDLSALHEGVVRTFICTIDFRTYLSLRRSGNWNASHPRKSQASIGGKQKVFFVLSTVYMSTEPTEVFVVFSFLRRRYVVAGGQSAQAGGELAAVHGPPGRRAKHPQQLCGRRQW